MSSFRRIVVFLAATTACFAAAPAFGQAPIAGSGQLPLIDPNAQSPRIVVDAVAKVMSTRSDKAPFLAIKECFRNSRIQIALRRICRQRLDAYQTRIRQSYASDFAGIAPIEIHIRLVELSDDPDAMQLRRDLFALRGVLAELDEIRRFRSIKECFLESGPQPALQQICRQQLDGFHRELVSTESLRFRDIKPEFVRRRLVSVATSEQVGFLGGDNSAFESLRDIRRAQRKKKNDSRLALVNAQQYYCRPSRRKTSATLSSQLENPGICLCSYGRRYAGSNPALQSRPVRVVYRQCGSAGRFRVGDLNGGRLQHGDWITLRAAHGGYVSMNRDGHVYANRQSAGKGEKFRVIRATNLPGIINPGEMITLISALGVFVVPDLKQGRLKATKTKPEPYQFLVLMPD